MTIIVNPAAGNGKCGRKWTKLKKHVVSNLPEARILVTREQGEATSFAQKALLNQETTLVAVGGDGTINEVINGFFREQKAINPAAKLAVLPLGTGSDFAKSTIWTKKPYEIVRCIQTGTVMPCDVGMVECQNFRNSSIVRYFINVADAGLGAAVIGNQKQTIGLFNARFLYLKAVLATLMRYHSANVTVQIDGKDDKTVNLLTAVIANGQYFGGGIHVAPHAQINSGRFEIVCIRPLSVFNLLVNIAKLYNGKIGRHPQVNFTSGQTIVLSSDTEVPFETDGELIGKLPATIKMLPAALNLIH